jgi:hypothetical protein
MRGHTLPFNDNLLIFRMCYCVVVRLGVRKSSEKEKREAHEERDERTGHLLPAFDKAR